MSESQNICFLNQKLTNNDVSYPFGLGTFYEETNYFIKSSTISAMKVYEGFLIFFLIKVCLTEKIVSLTTNI